MKRQAHLHVIWCFCWWPPLQKSGFLNPLTVYSVLFTHYTGSWSLTWNLGSSGQQCTYMQQDFSPYLLISSYLFYFPHTIQKTVGASPHLQSKGNCLWLKEILQKQNVFTTVTYTIVKLEDIPLQITILRGRTLTPKWLLQSFSQHKWPDPNMCYRLGYE